MNMKKIPLPQIVGGVLTVGLAVIIIYGSVNDNGTSDNAVTTESVTVTTAQTTPAQTTTEATTTTTKETTTTKQTSATLATHPGQKPGEERTTKFKKITGYAEVGYNEYEIYPGEYTVYPTADDAYIYISNADYDYEDDYYDDLGTIDITENTKITLAEGDTINLHSAYIKAKVNLVDQITTAETNKPISEATIGEMNALEKACSYLMYTHFSYTGLIKQLEYEGFTEKEAEFGADNVGIDWNEQAAGKARDYLNYSAFSREGLRSQLEYEGFTDSQIDYALSAVGY